MVSQNLAGTAAKFTDKLFHDIILLILIFMRSCYVCSKLGNQQ